MKTLTLAEIDYVSGGSERGAMVSGAAVAGGVGGANYARAAIHGASWGARIGAVGGVAGIVAGALVGAAAGGILAYALYEAVDGS
ncbi:bacteriocin, lactobin A family protein [Caulobacter vibrioides]|uniref:Killing protein CdzD n=1 Tax=Caulobacter vibrioides (strain NA1000 / CB15N) TaxID=565050 RepID=A0A0H3J1I9_CAUVN|nr:hypothetical protein [Caulobacter vibrioides]YP_009020504.1 killing protein CdzD [Caulobacter vibrioides NA1000]AHI88535.1 killing protein CdzD [Caulobacter vibrioides NA1000]ATC27524.1 bacteriocin, lactobin A family protein [Caulobacter vibrioides]AZH11899.1 bacteriocin, lactobin A family protein [Caulobacter vibrioides]QXZ52763.1 hypothetical protein KZH45_03540 [Caulobacter vibrioides]